MARSIDNREPILERLLVIAATIVPAANVFRNVDEIPEGHMPAIVINDGDEFVRDSSYGRGRPINAPVIVDMEPEFHFVTGDGPADIGTRLNVKRRAIIKAICQDQTLVGLCHDGDIRYLGIGTGLGAGRSMLGEMSFAFSFAYVLRPASL